MAAFTDLVHKWEGHAKHNTTLPTATDGQVVENQCDTRGRLIVAIGADVGVATESSTGVTWVNALTHDDKGLVTATAAKSLCSFYVQSSYATAGYIAFFNLAATASLSSGVTVPHIAPLYIPAMGLVSISFARAKLFATGIVWAFSSTPNVWTEVAAATVGGSFEIV